MGKPAMSSPKDSIKAKPSGAQSPAKAEMDWTSLGLPGFHMNLLLAPYPHRIEELGGLPGNYTARFTLSRPGFSLQPEYDLDLSENLKGDSHLAITEPAMTDPNNPGADRIKLNCNTDDGNFVFHGFPNPEGYLSYLETEPFHAEQIADATIKAFRALTPVLSNTSVYLDVPLHVYQITVVELRNNNSRVNLVVPYQAAPLVKIPIENLTSDYRVYAGVYREALNSNSMLN